MLQIFDSTFKSLDFKFKERGKFSHKRANL